MSDRDRGPACLPTRVPTAGWTTFAALLVVITLSLLCGDAAAQPTTAAEPVFSNESKLQPSIDNLATIQQSIAAKRESIRQLRAQAKRSDDPIERQDSELKIERLKTEILSLQQSFENIALGGINVSVLADQVEQKVDWRDEIEQVSRPLLSTLKELTAKPRQVDSLRREIDLLEDQLRVTDRAVVSIERFARQELPAVAVEPLQQLQAEWSQRREDTRRTLEVTRIKLQNLQTEGTDWTASAGQALGEFARGRGLTLVLALLSGISVWLLAKLLLRAYWRLLYSARHDIGIASAPLFYYSYRLATAATIIIAVLLVFYIRGDVLLLTLALIALAAAALTLRQTLPRYASELRLLLGVGPVRETERLVYAGIPFEVESLSLFTVLRNPGLEGVIRLPLHTMSELASRPAGDETWFPCKVGDYIVLENGSYGRVLRQTVEFVELAVLDSLVQVPTPAFLSQNIRNLSRDGFGIACTFGVDYQHQDICLDTVPVRLKEAILAHFQRVGLGDDVEDLLVEFSQAGASSLDYRIYMILNGRAAKAFYRAQRLVQQACVATCNREQWVIPFTQVTVHAGNADPAPMATASRSQQRSEPE